MATYRTSAAGGATSGTGDRTAAITPAVGDLLIGVCFVSTNTNDTPTMTDNNGSGTYTRILTANVVISSINHRLSVFVRDALMVNTTSTTVTAGTGSNTSGVVHVIAVSGMSRVGSNAIRSQGLQNNQAAGTAAPALNQAALTGNVTIAGVGSADTTTTAPTNWTERQDTTQSTPTVALETATRDSGFTGTTITFGAAQSTTFASYAIELDGSAPAVDLVIANASHAHSAENAVLTQVHSLAVNNGAHGHTAQNLALTETYNLTVNPATHGHTAQGLTLEVAANLEIQNAAHGHSSGNLGLTQDHALAVQGATHGHAADNLSLTQVHNLTVDNASHAHAVDGLALTQVHGLIVGDGSHGQSADNVGLSGAGSLGIQDATHGHTAEQLSLTQSYQLQIANALHGHSAETLTLTTEATALTIQNASHSHSAGNVVLILGDVGGPVPGPTGANVANNQNSVTVGSSASSAPTSGPNQAVVEGSLNRAEL